jgi:hypothetical protein
MYILTYRALEQSQALYIYLKIKVYIETSNLLEFGTAIERLPLLENY